MKTYAQLGHVWRTEPCVEYPGEWIVYSNGNEPGSFPTFDEAYQGAVKRVQEYDSKEQDQEVEVSICWACSDKDPRIGEVWFTSFYKHGKFNQFGSYVST